MRQSRRVTIVEICVVIVFMAFLAMLSVLATSGYSGPGWRRTQCKNNLRQIGTAVAMYVNAYGGDCVLPVPATQFRGDTWLCVLYWKGLISDKRVFVCPSTADSADALQKPDSSGWGYPITYAEFGKADTIGSHQVSYCGRTNMSSGTHATVTPTEQFNVKAFKGSPIACDKAVNHDDMIHVLFSGGYVESFPDAHPFVGNKTQTGATVFQRTLQYMDNGDP